MLKSLAFFSLLAAISAANAQSPVAADPQATATPAPIVRAYPVQNYPVSNYPDQSYPDQGYPQDRAPFRQSRRLQNQVVESQPVPGIWLRSQSSSAVKTIAATPQHTEIRLDRGVLNVTVHHPADHAQILVDLPGGQVDLFKDGLYTFNAETGTVRVLHGEAAAYPGPIVANSDAKPVKIKEDHQLSLVAANGLKSGEIESVESYPYELTADLLQPANTVRGYGNGYADYGDGYAPSYAGAWGSPYGYSGYYPGYYPGYYGYGYPFSYGIGIGYYGGFGGFGGGGFGGGFAHRGGFRR
jgi:hypothetical protein